MLMIDARNILSVNPFDLEDARIAKRLGIHLPDLWMTERYEERLAREGFSLQVDPDKLIAAFDRLEIGGDTVGFGVLFDSLGYEAGPETIRKYAGVDKFRYGSNVSDRDSDLPFFTLLADPTPTVVEHSAERATFGLLLGSKVMSEMIDYEAQEELEVQRDKKANHLKVTGLYTNVGVVISNMIARVSGAYDGIPVVGNPIVTAVGAGVLGAAASGLGRHKSSEVKNGEVCEYAESIAEEMVLPVAQQFSVISFQPMIGTDPTISRKLLKEIRGEVENL
ncbi:MAG: hypothetical protein JWO47_871 [Candidatus Saccharibacteria bacterium]|nr:hypothetical protein [Candidatus Saccharibacteria bacterium]